MITIYSGRNITEINKMCSVWVEVENGLPIHPADLPNRILEILSKQQEFATCSETVLACVGYLLRKKRIQLPIRIQNIGLNYYIDLDIDGMPIRHPGDNPLENIFETSFYFRYS